MLQASGKRLGLAMTVLAAIVALLVLSQLVLHVVFVVFYVYSAALNTPNHVFSNNIDPIN